MESGVISYCRECGRMIEVHGRSPVLEYCDDCRADVRLRYGERTRRGKRHRIRLTLDEVLADRLARFRAAAAHVIGADEIVTEALDRFLEAEGF